ncbi:protoporphyrinogen oxidase [Petromyzon marinus]|uniref:Protoporphyrinogen oxidase n=1 Tax=Petromyzon marinus TaxID=7757 RepID=A0AAJ7XGB4_PETMA|nr:protoporphyrinogen oxidase [Petromyzon marinus]
MGGATIAVLGGGISGLASAYYAARAGGAVKKVVLLEAGPVLGGWVRSSRSPQGAVSELGPRSVRPNGLVGGNTLCLLSDLGLSDSVLPVTRASPAAKNRFVFTGGTLHTLPNSLWTALSRRPPFSRPLAWHVLREPFVRGGGDGSGGDDFSVDALARHRLGDELADWLLDPLCRGVFAGDSRRLSVRCCFPALYRAVALHGSIVGGSLLSREPDDPAVSSNELVRRSRQERWAMWSLREGMGTLPNALGAFLEGRGVELLTNAAVRRIDFTGDRKATVEFDGDTITVDHIISTLPAKALSPLLPADLSVLREDLSRIRSVTVAVVNLEYPGSVLPVQGFGHLLPSSESGPVLGVVYDSMLFPQHNRRDVESTRLTVMLGGAWYEEAYGGLGAGEGEMESLLADAAEGAVRTQLGVDVRPTRTSVSLNQDCIPQYEVGHWKIMERIALEVGSRRLPLSLTGASFNGVSINDCVYNAGSAVATLLRTHV